MSIDDLDSQVKPVVQEVTGDANIQISKSLTAMRLSLRQDL